MITVNIEEDYMRRIGRVLTQLGLMMLMHPAVILTLAAKQKQGDFSTGTLSKRNKSVPGITHKVTPPYLMKLPKTKEDMDSIDLAEARQLERGEKRRVNWRKSLTENLCVSFEQYQALGL